MKPRLFYALFSLLLLGMLAGGSVLAQSDPVPLPSNSSGLEAAEPVATEEPTSDLTGSSDIRLPIGEPSAEILNDDFENGFDQWVASDGTVITADASGNRVVALATGQWLTPAKTVALTDFQFTLWFNLNPATHNRRQSEGMMPETGDAAFEVIFGSNTLLTVNASGLQLASGDQTLTTVEQAYLPGIWHQLDLVMQGNHVSVQVNTVEALTYDFTNRATQSRLQPLTLRGLSGTTLLDDARLVNLAVQPPSDDETEDQDDNDSSLSGNVLTYEPARLSGELVNLLDAYQAEGSDAANTLGDSYRLNRDRQARISVDIWAAEGIGGDSLVTLIESLGGKVETVDYKRISARLELRAIAELSLYDQVSVIHLTPKLSASDDASLSSALRVNVASATRDPDGPIVSEGYDITGAQTWHVAGYTGGVRVGILDIGFGDANDNANNNMECLASGSIVLDFGTRQTGDSDRGLEMLEVICDVAPASNVRLYKVQTLDNLYDALQEAIADENRVIVIGADFGPNVSPGDGTLGYNSAKNPYSALQAARDAGIVVVSAAGNSRQSYTAFNFTGGSPVINITARPGANVNIGWNDWDNNQNGGGTREDFTATLTGAGFSAINKPSRGSSNPGHQFTIPTGCTASGGFCTVTLTLSGLVGSASIVQVQVTGLDSTITSVTGVTPFERFGTLARPADSANVITAGAFCASPGSNYSGLSYSSRGPIYLPGGNYTEIGEGPYTGNEVKPDVVGAAHVTTSFGAITVPEDCNAGFGGTQAGAAHVAGQVAVLLSNNSINTFKSGGSGVLTSILKYLRTHSFDLPLGANANGYDMRFGAGVPVLGSSSFNPDNLPDPSTFITPNRIPPGECTAGIGGLIFVGPYSVGSASMNGTLANPYTHIAQAINVAAAAGPGRCVIALPGEYSTPLYINNLPNTVGLFSYTSVILGVADDSTLHVHNSYVKDINGFSHQAGVYVDQESFRLNGFDFSMGKIYENAVLPEPGVLLTDGASDVLFSYNTIKGFDSTQPLIQVLNGSEDITIRGNVFTANVNSQDPSVQPPDNAYDGPMTLISVEDSGTAVARIVIDANTFRGNESVYGLWSLDGLPQDSEGNTSRLFSWVSLIRLVDSYTDITNNTFRNNQIDTLIQAVTRQVVAPFETRILGNAIVNNTSVSYDMLTPGPLIHLFNMQRIYVVNNTIARNDLTNSGGNGVILARGDEIIGNFIDNGAINNNNSGSMNENDTRWEFHGNFVMDNVRDHDFDSDGVIDDIQIAVAAIIVDLDVAGAQCKNLAVEGNKGAQYNWIAPRAAQGPGVCGPSFNNEDNHNIMDKDPYPRNDQYVPIPDAVTYILGGEPEDRSLPGYYSLTGASDDSTEDDGIDEGPDAFVTSNLTTFANGFDARGVNRRNDGDADLTVAIDIGAYELTPLELVTPISLTVNEDSGVVTLELDSTYLNGGFPPYSISVSDYPKYYGVFGENGSNCDSRFTVQNQGVIVETLTDGTPLISYCPPPDFHTTTLDPDFDIASFDVNFNLIDSSNSSASGRVTYTIDPVDDQPLTTVLGDNNPAGDILDEPVGIGRTAEQNAVRLRPYVSFAENFFFSEWSNEIEPAAQNQVDYDFEYGTPTLLADAGNVNEAYLADNLDVLSIVQGKIGFDLSTAGTPPGGFAQAKFQYEVTDQHGSSVTNIITVRALIPPSEFDLLTPEDLTVFAQPTGVKVFTWEAATNATKYNFALDNVSQAVPVNLLNLNDLTPAADSDNLTCNATVCTLTLTNAQQSGISTGEYRWSVVASNDGVTTDASNAPFTFSVNIGIELLKNGSFELQQGDNKKLAQDWKNKNTDNDKRVCNKDGKPPVSFELDCAFKFKGLPGVKSNINQKIDSFGDQGDIIVFSYYANAKNLTAGASAIAKLTYDNGGKEKISLDLATGTYNYTRSSTQRTLADSVKKAKVKIQMKNGSGKFWIDAVKLVLQTDSSFDLKTPLDNDLYSDGADLTTLSWEVSVGAENYDINILRSGSVIINEDGLTAAADSDALTCDTKVCRFTLSTQQQDQLTPGSYTWDITANGGFVLTADNGPFDFNVVSSENLLTNSSFEVKKSDNKKLPQDWKAKNIGGSKLQCTNLNKGKYPAYQGNCAFEFKGAANYKGSLDQKFNPSGVGSGDNLRLHAVIKGNKVAANKGKVVATITFNDDTQQKLTIAVPAGEYDYTLFNDSFTINQGVTKIKVKLSYSGNSGGFTVDKVQLLRAPAP